MEEKRIDYVILTENNEWVSTGTNASKEMIDQDVTLIREDLGQDVKLFLYETVNNYEV